MIRAVHVLARFDIFCNTNERSGTLFSCNSSLFVVVFLSMKPTKKSPPMKTTLSLRLSAAHLKRLDTLAVKKGTTRSALIQLAVTDYLEKEGA